MTNGTSFDITQESNPVQTVAPTDKEANDMLEGNRKNYRIVLQDFHRRMR